MAKWNEVSGSAFFMLRQHCPPATMSKIKRHDNWKKAKDDADVIALLKIIRDLTQIVEEDSHTTVTAVKRQLDLCACAQTKTETPEEYKE